MGFFFHPLIGALQEPRGIGMQLLKPKTAFDYLQQSQQICSSKIYKMKNIFDSSSLSSEPEFCSTEATDAHILLS